jgi:hypothetical protein
MMPHVPRRAAAIFAYVGVEIFTRSRSTRVESAQVGTAETASMDMGLGGNGTIPFDAALARSLCTNTTMMHEAACVPGIAGGAKLVGFVAMCVLLVVVSRLVVVPPLVLVANLTRTTRHKLSPATTVALIAAGLRGAIAFALSKSIRSVHNVNMTAGAVGTIIFTVFVIGGSTRPLLNRLGLAKDNNMREVIKARDDEGREAADRRREESLAKACDEHGQHHAHGSGPRNLVKRAIHTLRHLDADYLRPMFIATKSDGSNDALRERDDAEAGEAQGQGVQMRRISKPPRPVKNASNLLAGDPFGPASVKRGSNRSAPPRDPFGPASVAAYSESIVGARGSGAPKGARRGSLQGR